MDNAPVGAWIELATLASRICALSGLVETVPTSCVRRTPVAARRGRGTYLEEHPHV